MADMILVKIAPLGNAVTEVLIPAGSTVQAALNAAKATGVKVDGYDDLRKNGKTVSPSDIVLPKDIITLVPSIRGGTPA
jgi:hypothetical protein